MRPVTLTPKVEVICCADAPLNDLSEELIAGVQRACAEHGISHLKTASGTLVPFGRWAGVALDKIKKGAPG